MPRGSGAALHADGVISQFEGYEQLAEFDWDGYRARYDDIGRLDLILAAEGDSPNKYRLAKQPDVLMLFYLLSAEELRETLERLGYRLDRTAVRRTVDFYLSRTSHGSTLSRPVCSWLLARADRKQSWSFFNEALDADLADLQRGTTHPSRRNGRHSRPAAALLHRLGNAGRAALAAPGPSAGARPAPISHQLSKTQLAA